MEAEDGVAKSSRLYVSGLPAYLDEQRLRATFEARGEVTDVKIIRTRDGRSRQFGFVGFVDERQAEDAIAYFDNSYLDTARINVKFAEVMNSANLGRPWSKHSKGSSAHNKLVAKEQPAEEPQAGRKAKKRKLQEPAEGAAPAQPLQVPAAAACAAAPTEQRPRSPAEEDPELQEFLRVMQPRRGAAVWANDDAVGPDAAKAAKKQRKAAAAAAAAAAEEASSDEEYALNEAVAEPGRKSRARKREAQKQPLPAPQSDPADSEGEEGGEGECEPELADEGVSDMDYLRSRVKTAAFGDDDDDEQEEEEEEEEDNEEDDDEEEGGESKSKAAEEAGRASDGSEASEGGAAGAEEEGEDAAAERRDSHGHAGTADGDGEEPAPVAETGRLFLRNLPYTASEADLAALFQPFGELSEVHLVVDRGTRKSKGIALLQFLQPADAEAAMAALDGSIFQGRLLHILPAKPAPGAGRAPEAEEAGAGEEGPKGYRQKREADRRADAGNRAAWNTLFMRPDTVAAAVAAHYGISKSQLLDKEAVDLPVRLALGETHVIALTKAALSEAGVDVLALEGAAAASGRAAADAAGVERSPTTLLVKNLPYSASEEDLLEVFQRPGELTRLVLPPTKTLALVEFRDAGTARRAFRSLAYKRFHDVPLYLEWAPAGIFRADAPARLPAGAKPDRAADEAAAVDAAALRGDAGGEEDVESCSIFVKGLAWGTSEQALRRHFDGAASAAGGSLRAAKIAKKRGPDGKSLSAGYGFVEFSSQAVAKAVLRKLKGSLLDGHKLQLQLSTRRGIGSADKPAAQEAKPVEKDGTRTKLVVRNIAFEATPKELRALFQPFGQVRSVRLPRKLDRSHRGFAFVDFLSHSEAAGAMEAVAGTHLYGRRLVCEWAAQGEEGVDELRAKTAARFQRGLGAGQAEGEAE